VNPLLPDTVVDFAASLEQAITAAGGVDLARRAIELRDGTGPRDEVEKLLDRLGAWDVDTYADLDSTLAAAAVARVAGATAVPWSTPTMRRSTTPTSPAPGR
jgi:hypothetical protein